MKHVVKHVILGLAIVGCLSACSDYEDARRAYERGDYSEAHKIFDRLSKEGHARAQFDLAHLYFSGIGVPVDQAAGWRFLLASADAGEVEAMVEVGMRYAAGIGTPQSLIMAARWYRRAGRLGHPMAAFNLASMHEAGTEVAKDPIMAYAWYVIAAKNGNMAGRERADELRSKMLRDDVERAERQIKKILADEKS